MSASRSRTINVTEAPTRQPKLTSTNYTLLSCILTGLFVIFTKDNQLYYTSPHGFDYFLNFVMAVQYSSAVNVLVGGLLELSCGDVSHTRWINFWNVIFFSLFPLYALLAAVAAGWYHGTLFSAIAGVAPNTFTEKVELQNNSIVVLCVICVLNYALVPLYVLGAWCCDPCKMFRG